MPTSPTGSNSGTMARRARRDARRERRGPERLREFRRSLWLSPESAIHKPKAAIGNRRGFTLLELTVVMVILALFTAVVTPSFVALHRESQMRTGLRVLVSTFRLARSLAVAEGRTIEVHIDCIRNVCQLFEEVPTEEGDLQLKPVASSIGRARSLPLTLTLTLLRDERQKPRAEDVVSFHPNGQSEHVILVLRDVRDKERAVEVQALTGAVRIADPADLLAEREHP